MSYHNRGNRSNRNASRSAARSVSQNAAGMAASNARVRSRMQSANNMNTLRANRGGNLTISSKTKLVDPPQGFHWMQENGRYFLMKGEYRPHPGAVRQAKFKLATHGKG